MSWSEKDISEFMAMVAPPGEKHKGFDDRILYKEAVEIAKNVQGDYGEQILEALHRHFGEA
jgi:hypothetical protein